MLPVLIPPSTSSRIARPPAASCRSRTARAARSLGRVAGMKDCPPKPGLTDMTRTRSSRSRVQSSQSRGVAGLSTRPARQPRSRMRARDRSRWSVPSGWMEIQVAPASAKSRMRRSTGRAMRCTSMGTVPAAPARALHTIGPTVRLGTKWLSITSKWMRSAPARTTAATSSPRRAKSAERREGAIHAEACGGAPGRRPQVANPRLGPDTASFAAGGVTPRAGGPRSSPRCGGRGDGKGRPAPPSREG